MASTFISKIKQFEFLLRKVNINKANEISNEAAACIEMKEDNLADQVEFKTQWELLIVYLSSCFVLGFKNIDLKDKFQHEFMNFVLNCDKTDNHLNQHNKRIQNKHYDRKQEIKENKLHKGQFKERSQTNKDENFEKCKNEEQKEDAYNDAKEDVKMKNSKVYDKIDNKIDNKVKDNKVDKKDIKNEDKVFTKLEDETIEDLQKEFTTNKQQNGLDDLLKNLNKEVMNEKSEEEERYRKILIFEQLIHQVYRASGVQEQIQNQIELIKFDLSNKQLTRKRIKFDNLKQLMRLEKEELKLSNEVDKKMDKKADQIKVSFSKFSKF